jgi:hypothetical protein
METIKSRGLGKSKGSTYLLYQYDSVRELADDARSNPEKQYSARYDSEYNLTQSFDEAYDLALHGWADIRPTVDATLVPLREKLGDRLDIQFERTVDMVGFEPDIDRYIAGEMDCMWDDLAVEAPKAGKVFTLVVDASMAWFNQPEDIAKRGAVLCGLVEAFIIMGYQLEVWVESTLKPGFGGGSAVADYLTRLVRVNSAGELLDIDNIMFAIGHPDFNRRLFWSVGEKYDDSRSFGFYPGGGYGQTRQGSHMVDRVGASFTVSLDGNEAMTTDPEQWILDQLLMQGVIDESVARG